MSGYDEYNEGGDADPAEYVNDYDVDNIDDPDEHILKETLSDKEDEDSLPEDIEEEEEEEEPDGIIEVPSQPQKIEVKYVSKEQRKTTKFMTIYEYARIIGERAVQIEANEPVHPSIIINNPNVDNALDLAELELNSDVPFPIRIERPVYIIDNIQWYEPWDVRELILPKNQIRYGMYK